MKYDEFAFVNYQLSAMLKAGIPLEGALRQICKTMRHGGLKTELEKVETELTKGLPIAEALAKAKLPEIYSRMVRVGIAGNDLAGVLTLLADYFQRLGLIGLRLKSLMIYPMIVLLASMALSVFLASIFHAFAAEIPATFQEVVDVAGAGGGGFVMVWMPVVVLSALSAAALLIICVPAVRRAARWRLPGFKDACLAQLASAFGLMLGSGNSLADALGLLRGLEGSSPLGRDLAGWESRLASGHARFAEIAAGSKVVPPLFSWLVSGAGEELAEGFRRAAEIYHARAVQRVEMLLYAALPISILFLGVMLVSQAYPLMRLFIQFGNLLDQLGG